MPGPTETNFFRRAGMGGTRTDSVKAVANRVMSTPVPQLETPTHHPVGECRRLAPNVQYRTAVTPAPAATPHTGGCR